MSSLQVSFKVPARFNYKMKINSNQDIKEFFDKMYDYENGFVRMKMPKNEKNKSFVCAVIIMN